MYTGYGQFYGPDNQPQDPDYEPGRSPGPPDTSWQDAWIGTKILFFSWIGIFAATLVVYWIKGKTYFMASHLLGWIYLGCFGASLVIYFIAFLICDEIRWKKENEAIVRAREEWKRKKMP